MTKIIFEIDGKTVFNIAFFGTLGYAAAKATIKFIKDNVKDKKVNTFAE